ATINSQRLSSQQQVASCNDFNVVRVNSGLAPQNCSQLVFTDATAAAIRNANNTYPFGFTRNPLSFSAVLSLPLFDGFQREQRTQAATASRLDAQYQERAREIQVT